MIRLREVVVRFGDVEALALEALDIADGERVGVRGPNGSGKTTLLRVLAGLLPPTSGVVEGLPRPGRGVLVHQRPYLFRGTAGENIEQALRWQRRARGEAAAWLDRVGAGHVRDRTAQVLSGGERRRVALARALAVRPDALYLDEPFAALDEAGRGALVAALGEFRGTLVIAAPSLAEAGVDRVVELAAGRAQGHGAAPRRNQGSAGHGTRHVEP